MIHLSHSWTRLLRVRIGLHFISCILIPPPYSQLDPKTPLDHQSPTNTLTHDREAIRPKVMKDGFKLSINPLSLLHYYTYCIQTNPS